MPVWGTRKLTQTIKGTLIRIVAMNIANDLVAKRPGDEGSEGRFAEVDTGAEKRVQIPLQIITHATWRK